jgi:hypothetical protein
MIAGSVRKCGIRECVRDELDGKIAHFQRMAFRITDQAMFDGIKVLIERAKAQKAELHPEQQR